MLNNKNKKKNLKDHDNGVICQIKKKWHESIYVKLTN